ncbi:phosphotransferase [Flexivirga caeni]|uniref:Aminoglycoside phosphotransferase n=1 Tax=Flexivirga caeni TaxID=2294115 RepID=A0A3M9M665_9MICO|nr:phosphotransferase [Flexivirga caeni]RNI21064.1 aminoglycoside phosphotransferase [Flexivirga caeni]
MLRSPLALAALATAAVPHFDPTSVQGTSSAGDDRFQIAYVTTSDGTQWVVRAGLSTAAGAQMEQSDGLLRLLTKRVPFSVPRIEGIATTDDGTVVAVQPRLPGASLVWRELQPGSVIARSIGRALAAVHDVDPRAVEEAGLPAYDADAYRARRLATLDRAAATGHVPPGLLSRWERALEEVALWKFATCTVHGPLEGSHVLVDGNEVSAITGWEQAAVSDPATDFAVLSVLAEPDAFDTVLEAYAGARHDTIDPHLERRVRLAAELQRVNALMDAVSSGDDELVRRRAAALRRLEEHVQDDESLLPPAPGRRRMPEVEPAEPAPEVDPDDIEVVEFEDAGSDDETVEIPVARRPEGTTPEDSAADTGSPEDRAADEEPPDDQEPSAYPIDEGEPDDEK